MKPRFAILALLGLALWARSAPADTSTIKRPGAHPKYLFEAEPHLLVDPFEEFDPGVGVRAAFEIIDNGFVQTINNTVGIGFGVDATQGSVRFPLVMQWNFWLSRNWSVFGEPGGLLRLDGGKFRPQPAFYAGGRFHFSDYVALTLRVGYPTLSVGVSFLL